jgi:tuberculosinol/isotuberculosinol synthase
MDRKTFLALPTQDIAQIMRETASKVCVFPINGTRRWFMLEHPEALTGNASQNYMNIVGNSYISLYKLFFDHGIPTLLSPIFGPDLMERGEAYVRATVEGMARLTKHPAFLAFYEAYDVRVRFYGDYRKHLRNTPYIDLVEDFAHIERQTAAHEEHRLFFGVFANDATETIAELTIAYVREHQCAPDRNTLVTLYYGEYVPPVDLFIGFEKFSAFDMPLLAIGQEDLYFTVAPSPYLTQRQLREILYDHLYARPEEETDYAGLTADDWRRMRDFYQANQGNTQGVGMRQKHGDFWHPLPQIKLPEGFSTPQQNCQHDKEVER